LAIISGHLAIVDCGPALSTLTNALRLRDRIANKTATGLTPLQYQQRLRLEYAGSLLRDSRLMLESIAESSGFADARHFRRLWKSTFHAPPSALRK
jgi:transcriptional regulator GlxA family with amidase domain